MEENTLPFFLYISAHAFEKQIAPPSRLSSKDVENVVHMGPGPSAPHLAVHSVCLKMLVHARSLCVCVCVCACVRVCERERGGGGRGEGG